jgi:hypothetical protein
MSKKFVILGTARSGTTFFAESLRQHSGIWVPKFPNCEPFNPFNMELAVKKYGIHVYDQDAVFQSIVREGEGFGFKYVGFKSFVTFHPDLLGLIERNDLDIFIVLRRDIWKILGSLLIAIDNTDFTGSSTKYKPYFYDQSPREARRVLTFFNELCKAIWWMESVFSKHKRLIHKFYLEDVGHSPVSFTPITEYFSLKIILDYQYDTNMGLEHYIENPEDFQLLIRDWCKKMPEHYSALPDYVREQLEI